jgi:small multidrug resistance pump
MIGWLQLSLAIAAEVAGTIALRFADGLRRPLPSVVVFAAYGLAFYLLSVTLKHLPVGLTYAIWSGVGTTLVTAIGIVALGEAATMLKLAGITLVVAGVVMLGLAGE